MGFGPKRHWWALVLETAGLAAVMVVLGVSLALLCAGIVSPYVDPLPALLPDPLTVVPWTALGGVFLIAIAVVLGGTAIAQASGSRVDVAEVLRDGT
jgi:ABC-type lipoprotein release transport system permease subunit